LTARVRGGDQYAAWVDNFSNQAQSYTLGLGFDLSSTSLQIDVSEGDSRAYTKASGAKR
jgi:hypothetical protein